MAKMNLASAPNAQMIKDVQDKSVKEINTQTVINIPLNEIDENPDNETIFNMDDINALAKNIQQDGFFGAIEVYLKKDGRYEISSGHRRFRAMQMLGKETIPAIVNKMPSDNKKRRTLIASNINIRNMTPMDTARALQYHYNTLKNENSENENKLNILSEYFNMTVMNVTRYLKLNKLIPELQTLVEKDLIPWTSIIKCADLSKEIQAKIYDRLKDIGKVKGSQVEKIIQQFASNKKSVSVKQTPIDRQIYRIRKQFEIYTKTDFSVANKNNLKKQIIEIEEYIKIIKKKL